MEYNFCHIYQIPFTGLGNFNGYRGDYWLRNRLAIFKEFVLPSLIAQGSRDFYLWFQWRPEEESNPIVIEFMSFMNGIRDVFSFHTFGGITFWDDKYDDEMASKRLMNALKISLPKLNDCVGDLPVLLTIQPSDDCYLSDTPKRLRDKFNELLNKEENFRQAVGYKTGYIMNYNTKELAEYTTRTWTTDETSTYHTDTTPPFFTILFPAKIFLDPELHYKHIGPYKSHEQIIDIMDYTQLEGRGFIVGTHGENISTTYNHRYRGRVLPKEEAEDIMIRAGLFLSKPIELEPTLRCKARGFINKIPYNNILKEIYYKLPKPLRII